MAPPHSIQLAGRVGWVLMIAIHDALRRDWNATADALRPGSMSASPKGCWPCRLHPAQLADRRRRQAIPDRYDH